jgi:excisionase family DNA binding protein
VTVLSGDLLDSRHHDGEELITIPEAAARVGAAAPTVWRWVTKGALPAYRVGRIYIVCVSDLDAFGLMPRPVGRPPMSDGRPEVDDGEVRPRVRFTVLERDNFTCRYCGRRPPEVGLHVDHVHPRSMGGRATLENLVTACVDCNSGKSDRVLANPPPSVDEVH